MRTRVRIFYRFLQLLIRVEFIRAIIEKACRFTTAVIGGESFYLESLRKTEDVDLVIDIGVYEGTPELYKVFGSSVFFLIDPLPNYLKFAPKKFTQFPVVLGNTDGSRIFYHYGSEGASSCYTFTSRDGGYKSDLVSTSIVDCMRLDSFLVGHCAAHKSIGIKIDAQGAEYEILSSLKELPSSVKWIIVENNVVDRYNSESHFSNITVLLLGLGFRFFNLSQQTMAYPSVAYDTIYLRDDHHFFGPK